MHDRGFCRLGTSLSVHRFNPSSLEKFDDVLVGEADAAATLDERQLSRLL
jgi:hypothetical protein